MDIWYQASVITMKQSDSNAKVTESTYHVNAHKSLSYMRMWAGRKLRALPNAVSATVYEVDASQTFDGFKPVWNRER